MLLGSHRIIGGRFKLVTDAEDSVLFEKEIIIPLNKGRNLLQYFKNCVANILSPNQTLVRFVVTKTDSEGYHCELGILNDSGVEDQTNDYVFEYKQREFENVDKYNVVMLIPTGIGAEIGGHAGDATPVARLLSGVCDTLILHPNVVNASDINEIPCNSLYVEGSIISRLFMGTVGLRRVRSNKIVMVVDKHKENEVNEFVINAASAARTTLGADIEIVMIDPPTHAVASYSSSGSAIGKVEGIGRVVDRLQQMKDYDAIAVISRVDVPEELIEKYFKSGGKIINPWGGVEAMITHSISSLLNLPSAHAPIMQTIDDLDESMGVVDPRMASEVISKTFLYCVLKGLHTSPTIVTEDITQSGVLSVNDISCLVIPDKCVGIPVLAAIEQGITVIAVRDNRNKMENDLEKYPFKKGKLYFVDNYFEAAGLITSFRKGINAGAISRPVKKTVIK